MPRQSCRSVAGDDAPSGQSVRAERISDSATMSWEDGMSQGEFDSAVQAYREALDAFLKGDPSPVTALFSRADDVTLANPLGPPHIGPAEVDKAIEAAAAQLSDGAITTIDEVARYSTADLGYVVQLERAAARLPGSDVLSPLALRVTMIFRHEGDEWRVVHRHADPITSARPITTTVET
jgi:ketosteroid isomerase-like protein